jgi:hypothetical protein
VSDDLSQAAESAEAAQGAVEPNAPAPWGDDFNPERAWQTISHLRGREKELESKAKQFERLAEDEDALREFLAERGFTFDEDDEEEPFDGTTEDDPTAELRTKLSELEQWKAQQEAERGLAQFNKDLDGFAKEASVELSDLDREFILSQTIKGGNNPKAAKAAFDRFVEHRQAQEKAILDRYLKSKTEGVPSPPQPGKAGKAEFDPTDRKARRARLAQIVAAGDDT